MPGQCTAPARENVGKPGCFAAAEITLSSPPPTLWWRIYEFDSQAAATAATRRQHWSSTAESHGRHWLYVLGARDGKALGGATRATIGPLSVPRGSNVSARFMDSIFTPGMRTRVYAHTGPEAFNVVDGEQCVETPSARAKLGPGDTFIVAPGPHVQAAAKGRKNLTLVLSAFDAPWMTLETDWTPSQDCAS